MTDKLWIQESSINLSRGYRIYDSDKYETDYTIEEKGDLYKMLQKQYGRCTGKVYIDTKEGKAKPIGWVFEKKDKYTDTGEKYLLETWVTLYSKPDTVTRIEHYVDM